MKFLLPHRFKRMGAIIAPLGFIIWVAMQQGFVTQLFTYFFGEGAVVTDNPPYLIANQVIAIISFFSFLFGLYFLSFSKEKKEDEMVHYIRMASFQFAASLQLIVIILVFLLFAFFKEPDIEKQMLFFIGLILIFWLSFIGRFNYILHIKKGE